MPTTTDIRVNDLIINKMTQEQYDALQEKSPTELYVVEGDSNVAYAEQAIELPTASESNLGKIYQYTGETDANYTNGYFYKCVSDGLDPATYSWQQVDVQPNVDPLPDPTNWNNAVLMSNGTTATWSYKPLVNTGGSNGGIAIGTNSSATSFMSFAVFGKVQSYDYSIAIGFGCYTKGSPAGGLAGHQIAIGYNSTTNGQGAIAIGRNAVVNLTTSNTWAIQLGGGTNTNPNTLKVGNYEMMSADGTIPEARLADTTSATEGQVLQLDSNNNAIWADVDSLPSQTGNAGKILGTDGTNAAWETKTTVSFRTWGINE